ncbi:MAG: hypothetical protein PHO13_06325 [Fermentimonas sp.]|jgi:hypothetical protein|nr:hypothetical protein [Fermentimonas sp.]MDD3512093.1 hypothetical protein [Fermentimonas sp.]MDD4723700.1 hypothetical protein [Fermentimonas sp.]
MKRFIFVSIIMASLPLFLYSQQIVITPDTSKLQQRHFDFNLPEKLDKEFHLPRKFSFPDTLNFNPGDTIPNHLWENFLRNQKDSLAKPFYAPLDQMPVIVPPDYNFSMIVVKPDSTVQYYIRNLHSGEARKTVPNQLLVPKEPFKPKQ